jgi:hypothetical protein
MSRPKRRVQPSRSRSGDADFQSGYPIGYDYGRAVRELLKAGLRLGYIADYCLFSSKTSVSRLRDGKGPVPDHMQGEALYVLYRQMFDEKPFWQNKTRARSRSRSKKVTPVSPL